ncbi:MAG: ATP-binding cassette domain-containing protein, partial [Chloroflexota bacterium]
MDTALQVKDLTKLYRQRRAEPVVAVDHVSFSVWKNEVVGLLGPNGAGKTTTIKCIAGLVKASLGEIWL